MKKLAKSAPKEFFKVRSFLNKTLSVCESPLNLPNCTKLVGYADNRYRWRIGEYRIIGIVENGETKIIQVIKISKRDENTYKGL